MLGAVLLMAGDPVAPAAAANVASRGWSNAANLLPAMGAHALRLTLLRDPNDFTANFVLQEQLVKAGAIDLSLDPLRRLLRLRPSNRTQIDLAAGLAEALAARQTAVADTMSRFDPADRTFANRVKLAQAGLLGAAVDQWNKDGVRRLSADQAEIVASWYLILGEPEPASEIYATLLAADPAAKSRWIARLGTCDLVAGRFQAALGRFESIAQQSPEFVEACYGSAIIHLIAGDRDGTQAAIAKALATEPVGNLRERLLELDQLSRPSPRK
jgi:tetratricopeptide (TPR) repeat protein